MHVGGSIGRAGGKMTTPDPNHDGPGGEAKGGSRVSFQAYLDNIEEKTGLTPRQFIELAHDKGLDGPDVKAGAIVDWLKADYDLGRGHAMALVHVIKNGPRIDSEARRLGRHAQ